MTVGIATCSALVCVDDKNEYSFLTHIDELLLLDNSENSGLLIWLKKLTARGIIFQEINLSITRSQGIGGIENPDIDYKIEVENLKKLIETEIPNLQDKIKINPVYEHSEPISCVVFRKLRSNRQFLEILVDEELDI